MSYMECILEYGCFYDDSNDDIVMEAFDLKESVKTLIQKLKTFLVNLIDKANNRLSKCKDSKIKSFLQGILNKLKELLTKTKSMDEDTSKEEVKASIDHAQALSIGMKIAMALASATRIDVLGTAKLHEYVGNMENAQGVKAVYCYSSYADFAKGLGNAIKNEISSEIVKNILDKENYIILLAISKDGGVDNANDIVAAKAIVYKQLTPGLEEYFNKHHRGEVLFQD